MNRALSFFFNSRKVARLKAEAARIDGEFERLERRASAELQAVRMRNAIASSHRILAWESGASLPCVPAEQIPERFS